MKQEHSTGMDRGQGDRANVPKKIKKLPVAISSEEFLELLKVTKQERHKLAFLLGFESGLRVSEVVKLEPRDVNLKEKSMLIRQAKGSKDRIVPLPKHFKEKYISLLPLGIGTRALQKAFLRNATLCKLVEKKPTIHFHSLRHGFATRCISQGVPIHHIRTLMGHTNISTTNVYLEANPKDALKSIEELF